MSLPSLTPHFASTVASSIASTVALAAPAARAFADDPLTLFGLTDAAHRVAATDPARCTLATAAAFDRAADALVLTPEDAHPRDDGAPVETTHHLLGLSLRARQRLGLALLADHIRRAHGTPTLLPTWDEAMPLLIAMAACPQTPTQSVLQHGVSVFAYVSDLVQQLAGEGALTERWHVPDWVPTQRRRLRDRLVSPGALFAYTVFHDCGKPACRTVDADGRQHFPDHARVSSAVWAAAGGDALVGDLIARDMDIHTIKAEGVTAFALHPAAATLLLVGLAELHSNAAMFGGTSSDSFKIKRGQIDRRGKAVLRAWDATAT